MQNSIAMLSVKEREARLRQSAIMVALCFLAIIAVSVVGLWSILSLGSSVGFYGSLAAVAALTDPMRRHLSTIFD